MKIGLVTLSLSPGGAERLILEQARDLRERGHTVRIYPEKDYPNFRESVGVNNIAIQEIPNSGRVLNVPKTDRLKQVRDIRSQILKDGLDFVISHYKDIEVYLATRGTDINYACHVNGSPFWFDDNPKLQPHTRKEGYQQQISSIDGHATFQDYHSTPIERLYYECRERLRQEALQESEIVTTLTDRVASELSFCYEIDPEVVRPGVSQDWFKISVDIEPRELPNINTDHMILNVGRLDRRKRNTLLIKSFAEFCRRTGREDVTLVIGGSGKEEDKLKSLVSKVGIESSVVFAGYIPEKDLPEYYVAADLLAHPAWVAYGLVPLEAYVAGARVAISTDTMVREIVEGEPGVSVVPPDVSQWSQKFESLLDNSEHKPNKSAVPTWETFCQSITQKYADYGLLKNNT
ncbi:glycosyltransferase family 4 protein [Halorubrum tebenquichense]|uniref:glycosyltransferase family 4 protein n=1 Tax=Halorubrum tebenquichense TaxID=119434 RepID=UPI0009E5F8CB|nr:glycosyltransferase family 4 protein [Halorubrum tebenquichense]